MVHGLCRWGFVVGSLLLGLVLSGPVAAEEQRPAGVAESLKPFVEKHTLAGAVTLVANRDKILDLSTVGYADIAAQKPMQPDQVVWIASMTKAFTAAAVMVLVDEGKLSLDDPIEKHLPEFKNLWVAVESDDSHKLLKRPSSKVTIRQTLCHTSGMAFKSDMEVPTLDLLTVREATLSYAITPLLSEPGTKYAYSNCGINTAGRICEVVSGQPFETFLISVCCPSDNEGHDILAQRGTADPAGQTLHPDSRQDRSAGSPRRVPALPVLGSRPPADAGGGLFSTATDVAHFCQMLLADGMFEGSGFFRKSLCSRCAPSRPNRRLMFPMVWACRFRPTRSAMAGLCRRT